MLPFFNYSYRNIKHFFFQFFPSNFRKLDKFKWKRTNEKFIYHQAFEYLKSIPSKTQYDTRKDF